MWQPRPKRPRNKKPPGLVVRGVLCSTANRVFPCKIRHEVALCGRFCQEVTAFALPFLILHDALDELAARGHQVGESVSLL